LDSPAHSSTVFGFSLVDAWETRWYDEFVPFGPWEVLIIAFLVLLLFGARKLPEIGRSLGTGMREFKDAVGIGRKDEPAAIETAALAAPADDDSTQVEERRAKAAQ
jgi:sec-independent protein translocase protein TatA